MRYVEPEPREAPVPTSTPPPTNHPTPTPTPTPTATPVPTPPPPPPPPGTPSLTLKKSAVFTNRVDASGQPTPVAGINAAPGDEIAYSLVTSNVGTATSKNHSVTESLNDVLEYGDITDFGGGSLDSASDTLIWKPVDIPAGGEVTNVFKVKIKPSGDPAYSRPRSSSDPLSYDLRMDNIYGNAVSVPIGLPNVPPPKVIETTTQSLPETGASTGLIWVTIFAALCVYFYSRNRQLVREVSILRGDYNGGHAQ